jgi:hypothetical protein
MRNGRDRPSENQLWVTRRKSAWFCSGSISGSHQGQRPNGPIQRPERAAVVTASARSLPALMCSIDDGSEAPAPAPRTCP